jgi:hypothetical protein
LEKWWKTNFLNYGVGLRRVGAMMGIFFVAIVILTILVDTFLYQTFWQDFFLALPTHII